MKNQADTTQLPIHLRLIRYKSIKLDTEAFVEWENRHNNKLLKSYQSYIKVVKVIPYREYCEKFYYGLLEDVDVKSYKNKFK
jgi:hypothetical protein